MDDDAAGGVLGAPWELAGGAADEDWDELDVGAGVVYVVGGR